MATTAMRPAPPSLKPGPSPRPGGTAPSRSSRLSLPRMSRQRKIILLFEGARYEKSRQYLSSPASWKSARSPAAAGDRAIWSIASYETAAGAKCCFTRAGATHVAPRGRQLPNRFEKNFFTLGPKSTAPSRVVCQALFAFGSAALPDSFSFSAMYFAPSATVFPR